MVPEISPLFCRATRYIMNIAFKDACIKFTWGTFSNRHSWTSPYRYFEAVNLEWEPTICALKTSPSASDVYHDLRNLS